MKVGIKDKVTNESVGEMHGGSGEVGYIAEMITDPAKLTDYFGEQVATKAKLIAEGMNDDNPEFPILRVEEGWSNSRRLWTANIIESIAEQTNRLEPVGHLGHIPDDQAPFAFPEVQTTWLGATTRKEASKSKERPGEMVTVAYFGGYNHPGAKIRGYIKSRAVKGVSWWGDGSLVQIPGKGVEVKQFTLKALDWARKLAEGMPTTSIVAVTGEMEASKMDKELAQVTPEEFKKENPNGYALLASEVTKEYEEKVGEMEAKVSEGEKAKSLLAKACEAIGISDPESLITELTAMREKVGAKASAMVKTALDALLEEKIPDEGKRAIGIRLLAPAIGEMETKAADAKDQDAVDKLVGEMLEEQFNKDEMIQNLVGEMSPPVIRRREDLRGQTGIENNSYVQRERVTLGS